MSKSSEVPADAVRLLIEKTQRQVKKQEQARTIELVHLKSHLAAFADQLDRNGDYHPDRRRAALRCFPPDRSRFRSAHGGRPD